MATRIEQRTCYITSDGKRFDEINEAHKHQAYIDAKAKFDEECERHEFYRLEQVSFDEFLSMVNLLKEELFLLEE